MAGSSRKIKSRSLHRWLGVIAAFPVLWLCVTGILINHPQELGLNDRYVKSEWLLGHYRQLPEGGALGFTEKGRRLANWGELIFLDDKLLGDLSGELVGATAYQTDLAVATTDRVHFYDQEGLHVDTLDEITLPEGDLQAIDVSKEGALMVWVNDASYRYDESLTSYDAEGKAINHPPSGMLPLKHDAQNSLRESLAKTAEIPWSRVLLDAHSGKLFDPVGRYVVTLATLALIALIISGLRLFPRRRRGRS